MVGQAALCQERKLELIGKKRIPQEKQGRRDGKSIK